MYDEYEGSYRRECAMSMTVRVRDRRARSSICVKIVRKSENKLKLHLRR